MRNSACLAIVLHGLPLRSLVSVYHSIEFVHCCIMFTLLPYCLYRSLTRHVIEWWRGDEFRHARPSPQDEQCLVKDRNE